MPLSAGTRLGPFEVLDPIGSGGMGVVYRAKDTRLGREVAIKVLPEGFAQEPDRLARFEREAKAVAALNHPNILVLFDFGRQDDSAYAVMELLEGETLRERLKHGALPPRKAIDYATQVAQGLAAAHERGIVHRDLKPENLFVTKEGRVKILDFGLARQAPAPKSGDDDAKPTLTQQTDSGTVMGTVGYMSPEQVRGEAADDRSDIFSLGAILYEMLSGRRAFLAPTSAETLTLILRDDPPDLIATRPGVPPALDRVLKHCLEKRREERLQSAHDLAFYLQALSGSSSAATPPLPDAGSTRRTARRLAGVALVAALAAASFVTGRRTAAPGSPQPTFRQLTFHRGVVRFGRFAPDGQTFLYTAAWEPGRFKLYSGRIDSSESRPLDVKGTLQAISSAGDLALLVDPGRTLARLPLAGGAPRKIQDDVAWADWSPDGKQLAIVRELGERSRIEYPIGNALYETAEVWGLRVSPSGESVAFLEAEQSAQSVVVADRRGKRTVLSRGWVHAAGLAWSPDGNEVWFTGTRAGIAASLNAVTLSGKERVVLRSPGGRFRLDDIGRDGRVLLARETVRAGIRAAGPGEPRERDLSWFDASAADGLSADGRTLLLTESGEGGGPGYSLYLRPTDGGPAVRLGEGAGMALSPDGKWALARALSPPQLFLLPTGAGEPRRFGPGGLTYRNPGGFFPDGRRVFFAALEPGRARRSYVLDLEGGALRPLTPEGVVVKAVSPDGQWLAASDQKLYPVDGGEPRPIRGAEPMDEPLGWSSDARSIFVDRTTGISSMRVSRLDLSTGRRTFLKEAGLPDETDVVGVGSGLLTPDGTTYVYGYTRILTELYAVEGLR